MLNWQKEVVDESEFKKHCIAELTDAVSEVLIFKKINETITISEFNYTVNRLLNTPKDILEYLPSSHPVISSYEMKDNGGLMYRTQELCHRLTGDRFLTSQWDKEYFCNMLKLKLGNHYVDSTEQ